MEYKMSIKNFEMKIEGKTENGRTTMKTTIKPFTVDVEILLDAGQDMKGGLGKTGAKPKSLELITR